jgi:hypothetical protein
MVRNCNGCGRPYEAKTARSLFCADVECVRTRARGRKRQERGVVLELKPSTATVGSVEEATRNALTSANRVDSPAGQSALILARRLDSASSDTGSSLAALAKQHLAVLEEATKNAPTAADTVDDLRARRMARLGRHA